MNSYKIRWAALTAAGALVLAGCSVGADPAPETSAAPTTAAPASETASAPASATPSMAETASPEADSSTAAASASAEVGTQAWADAQINLFLNGQGAHNFDSFHEGTPHREIQSWSTPEPGILHVEIGPGDWSEEDLTRLALSFMQFSAWETAELTETVVTAEGSSLTGRAVRSDVTGLE